MSILLLRILRKVVLPAPDDPKIADNSPCLHMPEILFNIDFYSGLIDALSFLRFVYIL